MLCQMSVALRESNAPWRNGVTASSCEDERYENNVAMFSCGGARARWVRGAGVARIVRTHGESSSAAESSGEAKCVGVVHGPAASSASKLAQVLSSPA